MAFDPDRPARGLGRGEGRFSRSRSPTKCAATLLGPASPGRVGDHLRVSVFRAGGGIGPDQAEKLFRKLDEERIRGTVSLVTVAGVERQKAPREPAAELWDLAETVLPRDWSDLLAEVDLASSDYPRAPRCCSRR